MNYAILKEALYQQNISLPVLLTILFVAFILGALHALGPGHGKTLMAAYLVGSKGRVIDAIVLALTLTVTHVLSVLILGFIALWISDFFMPEMIAKWMGLFSGSSIVAIGVWLFCSRFKVLKNKYVNHDHDHSHPVAPVPRAAEVSGRHSHHGENHHHHYDSNLSFFNNVALGVSGGMVPCPKALVILLLAISLQKITLGILIVVVFSFGLSLVLVVLGIVMIKASHLIKGRLEGHSLQYIPIIGAVIIVGVGVFWSIRSILLL
ncbi:MAG: sulfite exporter TauE/SafE family protein [Thermodesulfobacteriota bacterium]|nr:sulfite exporter TauE/SafE family protein [Thermodesulfobacteriota bacterium]